MANNVPCFTDRRIAWDQLSFQVPANWELAHYRVLPDHLMHIELEDEYATRLEGEWVRPDSPRALRRFRARYAEHVHDVAKSADRSRDLADLPQGWTGDLHEARPTRADAKLSVSHEGLFVLLYQAPDNSLLLSVQVPASPDFDGEKVVRTIAASLTDHTRQAVTPWELFDVAFSLPSGFLLEQTSFDIGEKLFIFRNRQRRLHLWFLSCADQFLQEGVKLEDWVTGYLNSGRWIPGIVLMPGEKGEIRWKRRFPAILAHRDEIGRWCFRHTLGCRHETARNRVVIWHWNHRNDSDHKWFHWPEPVDHH